ncbi:MAG: right-handed parallel beta-helix repeat-containing protein [Maribacter sp.]|nr:right-handed parallel beta-helix repeat-containing protein [Maribacter sp.]
MKKLIIPLLAIFLFASCTNEELSSLESENSFDLKKNNIQISSLKNIETSNEQFDAIAKDYYQYKVINEARLASRDNTILKKGCVQTAKVPEDYPTIQEAVDAVCENGNVIVEPGTYNEYVLVTKPGIFLKAVGEVLLNGGFALYEGEIKIHNFKIDDTTAPIGGGVAIASFDMNGFDIKNNTIYGSGHLAIYFKFCDNARIVGNDISGEREAAIYLDAYYYGATGSTDPHYGTSNNNSILNNTISDIVGTWYPGYGIVVRGNSDYNKVNGNNINTTNGWGISIWSLPQSDNPNWPTTMDENTDYNIVKNNSVKNVLYDGIEIYFGGSNNTIGPNNESNNNGVGIHLWEYSNNNHVFNNTARDNSLCDIVNEGANNTFKNNSSDCTIGVD